jgi:hypothetical protein
MSSNNIGLKLADGEFYPVLEDGTAARKRLVVTTVQDGQPSVQIDLYRGQGPTVEGASYIGSLVVEGIPSLPKGEPDIRMDLGLAADGTLTAFAQEASTGASQSLKVSLEALSEEEKYEVPDFEFSKDTADSSISEFTDSDFDDTDSLPPEADSAQLLADVRSEADAEEAMEKPKRKTLTIVLIALAILAVLALIGFLAFKFLLSPQAAATTPPSPPPVAAAPAPEPAPAKIETPAPQPEATPAPAPVAEAPKAPEPAKKAVVFKKPGVTYKIRWGDTLWDLSYTYYRNPWIYMKIAKANKIRNPDLIISGHKLWIPK